jgi:uncharacterized cupredoxin-like copper-binding protein
MHTRLLLTTTTVVGALLVGPLVESASSQATPDLAAFCEARSNAETTFISGDPESIEALLTTLETAAPPEVSDDAALVARGLAKKAEDAFKDKKFLAALNRIDVYTILNCGYTRIDVAGVDFAFEGIPATIPAGPTAFVFTNEAKKEQHEMLLLRRNEDVTDPAKRLLALREKKLEKKVDFISAASAGPGATQTSFTDLTPGRYIVTCFIPTRTGKHRPHWKEGMYAEFEVA